jgi:hypothetical protein
MTGGGFLWQKYHADAILTGRRQVNAMLGHFFAVELVRDLNEQAGTVAGQCVRADSTAVIQVFQDQQALLDDAVAFLALEVRDETYTTSVVFVGGVIETLLFRDNRFHHARILQKNSVRAKR